MVITSPPRGDPLIETLFRATSVAGKTGSAAPVRAVGTRSRAGNAMHRTRAALLDGARRAVQASGTKITMAQVASAAGVAKATLYNHFRTREAVLDALLADEVAALVGRVSGNPAREALREAARAISDHRLLRTLARREPQVLLALARVNLTAPGWRQARETVAAALAAEGYGGVATVLRWLAALMINPIDAATIDQDVDVLIHGLPRSVPDTAA